MSGENEDKRAVRRRLLGDLSEEEERRLEERFMTDADFRESVLMEENELIEDYLEKALSEREMEKFHARYLSTPRQRRKVHLARALKKYAEVESAAHSPLVTVAHTERASWRRLLDTRRLRSPRVFIPLAAALVVASVFGVFRFVEFRRASEMRAREEVRRLETERELAQLNDPVNPVPPPAGVAVFSVPLMPVNVRGSGDASRVSRADSTSIAELRLLRSGDGFQNYRATLRQVGSDAVPLTIPNLHLVEVPGGRVVLLRIPVRLLARGAYRLMLSGVGADGRAELVDEYSFEVFD